MTKKETYISFIKDHFRKGNVDRAKILSKFVQKWEVSSKTFDRHLKIAQEDYNNELRAIENQKTEANKDSQKEAAKRAILTKHEALEILSKQARGIGKKNPETGEILVPSFQDQRGAIERMSKIEGWDAPAKTAITDTEGNDVKGFVIGSIDEWLKEGK